jgi:hypothetical protein
MATKAQEAVELKEIKIQSFKITLVGDSPLIVHAWSEKAKKEMLDKQTKKPVIRETRDPVKDFINALYWLTPKPETMDEAGFEKALKKGAKFGFPNVAFKAAAASAGFRAGITKNLVSVYGSFHIDNEFAEIKGTPEMREDMVVLSGIGRTADLRFRPEFKEWETTLTIKYNTAVTSPEILVNLFNLAGFSVGIGEWRVEKGGVYGSFHVKVA